VTAPYGSSHTNYFKVDGISTEMVYGLQKTGTTIDKTGAIYIIVDYVLNETTPGANVDGDRRVALIKLENSSVTSSKYYKVKRDWNDHKYTGSCLSYYEHVNSNRDDWLLVAFNGNRGDSYVLRLDKSNLNAETKFANFRDVKN
jgi:hypothetical protein